MGSNNESRVYITSGAKDMWPIFPQPTTYADRLIGEPAEEVRRRMDYRGISSHDGRNYQGYGMYPVGENGTQGPRFEVDVTAEFFSSFRTSDINADNRKLVEEVEKHAGRSGLTIVLS